MICYGWYSMHSLDKNSNEFLVYRTWSNLKKHKAILKTNWSKNKTCSWLFTAKTAKHVFSFDDLRTKYYFIVFTISPYFVLSALRQYVHRSSKQVLSATLELNSLFHCTLRWKYCPLCIPTSLVTALINVFKNSLTRFDLILLIISGSYSFLSEQIHYEIDISR